MDAFRCLQGNQLIHCVRDSNGKGFFMFLWIFVYSFYAVELMRAGSDPTTAATTAVQKIAGKYPSVSAAVVALNLAGEYGKQLEVLLTVFLSFKVGERYKLYDTCRRAW